MIATTSEINAPTYRRQRLQVDEGRRADLHPVGRPRLAHDVEPQLLGRLDRLIDLPLRRIEPFGHDDELMYQLLHAREHPLLGREHELGIVDIDRSARHVLHGLPADSHRLPHLSMRTR